MNCAGSERADNKKVFDCKNMGEVLGKECVKDESFTHSSQESIREVGKGSGSSVETSGTDSDQDVFEDSDDDISWLLSFNKEQLVTEKCKCEGCLRRNETCNNKKSNAKLLLSSWKELQNYIRNVYINSPLESAQRTEVVPIEENERLYEMIQIMRLCDPYQLFLKIEEEVQAMVMRSRNRQLSLLKHEFNPVLAGEFITGLIEEYVKLLSSALQLGPAIDILLMSQFQRFGLSWDMLNKHLYQSLVYNHSDVQNNLPRFISHLTVIPFENDVYHELVHQYLAFDDEMASIAEAWEKIEPVIQEYKVSKLRETETLNSLQDALKAFFASRPNSVNGIDGVSDSAANKNSRYCPNCLTMRGCPCDECTVTHILACEGMESPPFPNSPIARSRTPNKDKQIENKDDVNGEEQQSCECHACAAPPPELMDCSVAFSQITSKNSPREGFQLYPHIHGTVTETIYETDNISSIYTNLQATPDSVYPHLYNLHSQTNSVMNVSQINLSGVIPNRSQTPQPVQTIQSSQSVHPVQPVQPAQSAQNAKSAQPVQSAKSVKSAQPAQPILSTKSVQAAQAVQPPKSAQSTQPVQSAKSAQSTQPVQSAKSAQAAQAVQPPKSAQSTQPVQSAKSAQAAQAVQPPKSAQSTQPVQSAKSAQSTQPVQSAKSAQAAQTVQPAKSAQSTQSVQSAKSAQAAQTVQPAKSAQSTQSVQSAKSAQTAQPSQPAKSTQPVQPTQAAKSVQPPQAAKTVQPSQSAKSVQPPQSAKSTQPVQPSQSAKSTQPIQPANSSKPTKSAKSVQTVETIQQALPVRAVSMKKIQPVPATSTQQGKSQVATSVSVNIQSQLPNCPPPLPPPSQDAPSSGKLVAPKAKTSDKTTMASVAVKPVQPKQMPTAVKSEINKRSNSDINKPSTVKVDDKKNQPAAKVAPGKENDPTMKSDAEKAKLLSNTPCVKSRICGKCCLRHGPNCVKTLSCGKSTDKHLAAIARLGYSTTINARGTLRGMPGKESEHTHKPGKGHSCGKLKSHDMSRRVVNGKLNGQEPDDSSSQDDSCSERSNSTSTSTQRETRHCDCCYCEVFGHGVPQVAPVSRNYQEMRERLRIKLNMKKSAKGKAAQPEAAPAPSSQDVGKKNAPKEKDLESLLKFIEGKTREACKDPKRLAKRARQKQKKQEEKERMEEEAERKRVEAMKRAQAAKQNQSQQSGKQQQHPNNKSAQNSNNSNNNKNNRNNAGTSNNNQSRNNQTLNLSGLKSLVEKSDPNSGPKMVTIRRVMAPFSAEPTVTITLKGSTPDKDKVLFMLKNGSEAYQPEDNENSKKGKKNKKKGKKEQEYYEEEEAELLYEEEPEPVVEETGSKKKKKNKNKNAEESSVKPSRSVNQPESSKVMAAETNKNSKNKNSKNNSNTIGTSNTGKNQPQTQTVNKGKSSNANVSAKSSQNSSSPQVSNSKGKSQKNVPVLKPQNQNVKSRDNVNNKTSSKNAISTKNSGRNNNNNNNNNVNVSNSNSASKNSSSAKGSGRNNNAGNNVNVGTKNSKNNQKQSTVSGANEKIIAGQSGKNQTANAKQSKNKKGEEVSLKQVQNVQTKGKINDPKSKPAQKNGKNAGESVQKTQPRQEVKQNVQRKEKQMEPVKTVKNSQKTVIENRDANARFSMGGGGGGGYERGKVVINTPSYRLSEVLSSIAPSPPPKEEINLENLRLPPGITITKIEGPITKSVRANDQAPHVSKPVPPTPPMVVSTPSLKQSHTTPPGNVIVVDTGRLKDVIKENPPNPPPPAQSTTTSKRKKKKNKQNAENMVPLVDVPMPQNSKYDMKINKSNPLMGKSGVTVISPDEARKMVPNLENQQATIIKTSDNMVTIRSPAFQQAMNMQAYQNSSNFRPGVNGYNNVTLFQNDVSRITDSMGKFNINPEDKLATQMRNLNIKEGSRASEIFAQAMTVAGQNGQDTVKKRKKKRKSGSNRTDEKEVEPVESVFQPKDIDLENGDIDDDERELEAFKRFCLQSVPSERKNKVKVNLNLKDIVLKKKSSAVGCS